MVDMKFAKLEFKFNNQILLEFFNKYFTNLKMFADAKLDKNIATNFVIFLLCVNRGEKIYITCA